MTVKPISDTHVKCIADEGKKLYFGDDTKPYSEIVCKTKDIYKVKEVEGE